MVGQALLTLLAAASVTQEAKTTQFASLEALLSPLAKQAGYEIAIPDWLAGRPVVYYYGTESPPMERLTGLAKNLFLELKVDPEKKTIKVSRSGKLNVPARRERIRQALVKFRETVAPLAQLTAPQLFEEAEKYRKLVMAEQSNGALAQEYNDKEALLGAMITSRGAVIVETLLESNPDTLAQICVAPTSKRSHVALTSRAMPHMRRYLAGEGVETSYYSKSADRQEIDDETRRAEGAAMGQGRPFSYLTHSNSSKGAVYFMLKVVSSSKMTYPAVLSLPLPPIPPISVGPQGSFEGFDEPFELTMPFKYPQGMTLNGLGAAAITLKCNYAGWFTTGPLARMSGERESLRGYLKKYVTTFVENGDQVRIKRDRDWLQVIDNSDPWPEYGIDWRPFDKLKEVVEGKPLSQRELLTRLEALDEKSIGSLEETISQYGDINASYYGITGGVRLLRAILRDASGNVTTYNKSLREMSKSASREAMKFFEGSYVWNYSPSLMHSDNLPKLLDARLKASIEPGENGGLLKFELVLPPEQFKFRRQTEFDFTVPIRS